MRENIFTAKFKVTIRQMIFNDRLFRPLVYFCFILILLFVSFFSGLLNRLTPDNFDKLSAQFLDLQIDRSEDILRMVVEMIYNTAVREHKYSLMYADLCKKISDHFQGTGTQKISFSLYITIFLLCLVLLILIFVFDSCS
jgi:hypothetical protein